MDFTLSEEQRLLADSARRWATRRCGFAAWQTERRAGRNLADLRWPDMVELGWSAMALPEADGGLGAGPVECGLVAEVLGAALVAEPFLQNTVIAAALVRALPASAARDGLARALVQGARIALAHSEAAMPDDDSEPRLRAQRQSLGWRLDGSKTVVLGGASADWVVVSAASEAGPLLFALPTDVAGLVRQDARTLDAQSASELTLDNVHIDAAARLCAPGGATAVLARVHDAGLAAMGAEAVGLMERLLNETIAHTRTRQQFGQPLSNFQVLRHRLVDMSMALEATRSLVLLATLRLAEGDADTPRALAAMKFKLGQAGRFVSQHAIQLHGAIGMTDDLYIGHAFKRLMALDLRLGNADHHLQRLVGLSA